jgi:hypothetical protein
MLSLSRGSRINDKHSNIDTEGTLGFVGSHTTQKKRINCVCSTLRDKPCSSGEQQNFLYLCFWVLLTVCMNTILIPFNLVKLN